MGAEEALEILNTARYKEYTHQGDSVDATSLENMKKLWNGLKSVMNYGTVKILMIYRLATL